MQIIVTVERVCGVKEIGPLFWTLYCSGLPFTCRPSTTLNIMYALCRALHVLRGDGSMPDSIGDIDITVRALKLADRQVAGFSIATAC